MDLAWVFEVDFDKLGGPLRSLKVFLVINAFEMLFSKMFTQKEEFL